jgi:hypothetical protein
MHSRVAAHEVKINKGKVVLVGARIPSGLWTINLNHKNIPEQQANGAYTT